MTKRILFITLFFLSSSLFGMQNLSTDPEKIPIIQHDSNEIKFLQTINGVNRLVWISYSAGLLCMGGGLIDIFLGNYHNAISELILGGALSFGEIPAICGLDDLKKKYFFLFTET